MNRLYLDSPKDKTVTSMEFLGTTNIPFPVELAPTQFISDYYKKK